MFKFGDKIVDDKKRRGVIVEIRKDVNYPIYVNFENGDYDCYTEDGKETISSKEISLFKEEEKKEVKSLEDYSLEELRKTIRRKKHGLLNKQEYLDLGKRLGFVEEEESILNKEEITDDLLKKLFVNIKIEENLNGMQLLEKFSKLIYLRGSNNNGETSSEKETKTIIRDIAEEALDECTYVCDFNEMCKTVEEANYELINVETKEQVKESVNDMIKKHNIDYITVNDNNSANKFIYNPNDDKETLLKKLNDDIKVITANLDEEYRVMSYEDFVKEQKDNEVYTVRVDKWNNTREDLIKLIEDNAISTDVADLLTNEFSCIILNEDNDYENFRKVSDENPEIVKKLIDATDDSELIEMVDETKEEIFITDDFDDLLCDSKVAKEAAIESLISMDYMILNNHEKKELQRILNL